jgi:hypothetical protein
VFFLALIVGLGSVQRAKAQSISIDAPSVINLNTFVTISLDYECPVNSVTWNLDGGTVLNSYNNGTVIDVQWNSAGYKSISASAIVVCNYQQQLVNSSQASIQVVQPPNSLVTISGLILDQNGQGASGVSVSNGSTSTSTNSNGEYSFTVPYGWSGSISATPPACNGISITNLGYNNLTNSVINQNFNLTPPFQISYSSTFYSIRRLHPNTGTWRYTITFTDGTTGNFTDCNDNHVQDFISKPISQICVTTCSGSCSQCN